jgi:hypothetical protein
LLPIGWRIVQIFYANAGGKWPIQRQPLLVQYKHQVNPFLSMNHCTPLVISRNDKTSRSQLKLALTAIKNFLHYKSIGAPKKFKIQPRPLVRSNFVNLSKLF